MSSSYRAHVVGELARNGLDDPDLAGAIYMALDGLVLHQTIFGDPERTSRALAALRELLATFAAEHNAGRSSV